MFFQICSALLSIALIEHIEHGVDLALDSLLYEIAISVRSPATNIVLIIHLSRPQDKRASHRVAKGKNGV